MTRTAPGRLQLPEVTLCAATSVNMDATVRALEVCLEQIDFAACMLFTDANTRPDHPGITVVPIQRLDSAAAYSDFILFRAVEHVKTSHCLVAQWDGHVLDAGRWLTEFLDYDYIGASWPQFDDGHDIGNGGFSLRSRRLMEICRERGFPDAHPEDIAIGRRYRIWLESQGMRFASREIADRFSAERRGDPAESFGYHGVWNMPKAIGVDAFWQVYRGLGDRGSVRHDFAKIFKDVGYGPRGVLRQARLLIDRLRIK